MILETVKPSAPPWRVPYAVVYLTSQCNLSCSYCFVNRLPANHMTFEKGREVLDWLAENACQGNADPLILSFFGGEPLLRFPILKEMVHYGRQRAEACGKRIIFSVTSNGTLLTEEILDFLEKEQISLLYSIDGDRQTNDLFRTYQDGRSASDDICGNARRMLRRFPNTAARMTIVPENLERLADNIVFLHEELGFSFISPCPAQERFTDKLQWEELDRHFRRATEYFIDKALAGDYVHLHFLDNGIDQLVNNRPLDVGCGAGKTFVGIDPQGDIYPCHRFVSYASEGKYAFKLGNVRDGIDSVKALPFRRYDRSNILGCYTRCSDCPARDLCAGGCIALNHEVSGNFLVPPVSQQRLLTIWHSLCEETLACFEGRGQRDYLLQQIQLKPKSFLPLQN